MKLNITLGGKNNMVKRKNNMQKLVLQILIESKKKSIPYLTHKQIVSEIKKLKPGEKYIERKISQALYQLQKKEETWKTPKVIKKENGYTIKRLI